MYPSSFARGRPGAMICEICEEFAFWLQSYLCHSLIRQNRPMYLGRRVLSNLLLGWDSWTSKGASIAIIAGLEFLCRTHPPCHSMFVQVSFPKVTLKNKSTFWSWCIIVTWFQPHGLLRYVESCWYFPWCWSYIPIFPQVFPYVSPSPDVIPDPAPGAQLLPG